MSTSRLAISCDPVNNRIVLKFVDGCRIAIGSRRKRCRCFSFNVHKSSSVKSKRSSSFGRVKEWLSPPLPHQTVRTDFPYMAFVWHCPIAGDGFINWCFHRSQSISNCSTNFTYINHMAFFLTLFRELPFWYFFFIRLVLYMLIISTLPKLEPLR